MEAKDEVRKALRSLPWYLVGGYLFGPLLLAMFTAGASLAIYLMPILPFYAPDKVSFSLALAAVCAPGLTAWIFRQFFRAATFKWRSQHPVRY